MAKKQLQSIYEKQVEEIKNYSIELEKKIDTLAKRVATNKSEDWLWEISLINEAVDQLEIFRNKMDTFSENSVQQEKPK